MAQAELREPNGTRTWSYDCGINTAAHCSNMCYTEALDPGGMAAEERLG